MAHSMMFLSSLSNQARRSSPGGGGWCCSTSCARCIAQLNGSFAVLVANSIVALTNASAISRCPSCISSIKFRSSLLIVSSSSRYRFPGPQLKDGSLDVRGARLREPVSRERRRRVRGGRHERLHARLGALDALDDVARTRVASAAAAALAGNTRATYASQWNRCAWCEERGVDPHDSGAAQVAAYLAERADARKLATVQASAAAIHLCTPFTSAYIKLASATTAVITVLMIHTVSGFMSSILPRRSLARSPRTGREGNHSSAGSGWVKKDEFWFDVYNFDANVARSAGHPRRLRPHGVTVYFRTICVGTSRYPISDRDGCWNSD